MNDFLSNFRTKIATISTISLLVCGSANAAPTLASGVLSVGSDMTLPPYTYLNHGNPAGFDPEFIGQIASYLNDKTNFVDTRFANLILGIKASRYDIVASALYITPERAKIVDFVPYFVTGGALMVSSTGTLNPTAVGELCGKRIGSIKGAAWINYINSASDKYCASLNKPPIQVREYDTSAEAAQAILSHGVDATYEDTSIAALIVKHSNGRLKITTKKPLDPVVCGIAIRKGNTILKSEIESALTKMKSNGEYQSLLKKYNVIEPTQSEINKSLGI